MGEHYILDGHTPVAVDLMTWAKWYEKRDRRRVAATKVNDDVSVSTVFLGLDHSFGHGEPLLFETMIFGGPHDQYSEAGHAKAVALASGEREVA